MRKGGTAMQEKDRQPDERELDALLSDVKQLLGDSAADDTAPLHTNGPRASDVHIDYEMSF